MGISPEESGGEGRHTQDLRELRSAIPRPRHEASFPTRERVERSLEVALARLQRFQPREIAENLLLPARNQRLPVLHRSWIFLQRRLEP